MDVFTYENYRSYLKDWLAAQPQEGRGQLAKIAKALGVHASIVTLVVGEKKELTLEQANDLTEYWNFSDLESDYFICLVQIERAGKTNLKERWRRRLKDLREKSLSMKSKLPPKAELSPEAQALFYSQWYLSGIRIFTSTPGPHTVDSLAERFKIPRQRVKDAVDFLLAYGLIVEDGTNGFAMGPQSTHVDSNSPHVARHHSNWRLKAMERIPSITKEELSFTSPVSLSADDFLKIRGQLAEAIKKVFETVDPSPSETTAVLTIDWLKF